LSVDVCIFADPRRPAAGCAEPIAGWRLRHHRIAEYATRAV